MSPRPMNAVGIIRATSRPYMIGGNSVKHTHDIRIIYIVLEILCKPELAIRTFANMSGSL